MPLRMKKIATKDFLAMENPAQDKKILAYQPATGELLKLEMVNQTLEERNEMLSQNLTGTISDDELENATVTLKDTHEDLMRFDVPLRDIEFYQVVDTSAGKTKEPRQKKPQSFWNDVPSDVKNELVNADWLDQDG